MTSTAIHRHLLVFKSMTDISFVTPCSWVLMGHDYLSSSNPLMVPKHGSSAELMVSPSLPSGIGQGWWTVGDWLVVDVGYNPKIPHLIFTISSTASHLFLFSSPLWLMLLSHSHSLSSHVSRRRPPNVSGTSLMLSASRPHSLCKRRWRRRRKSKILAAKPLWSHPISFNIAPYICFAPSLVIAEANNHNHNDLQQWFLMFFFHFFFIWLVGLGI